MLAERLASQPTQSRLIDILTRFLGNPAALRQALADGCARHLRANGGDHAARRITVDIDSFAIETHGHQQGTRYNGHYRIVCYHPLVASYTVAGDYDGFQCGQRLGQGFVHAILRAGNVHTASGANRFFREVVRKSRQLGYVVDLRFDAGFTSGEILDMLRDEGVHFLGRLKSNPRLDAAATPHLTRPAGRPPKEGYEFTVELGLYQADSWRHAQRVILVVVDQPDAKTGQLNLQPDYFFLVTDRSVEEPSGVAGLDQLPTARHVRGSAGRISCDGRSASLVADVCRKRNVATLVAVVHEPGERVAVRSGKCRRRVLGSGAFSAARFEGWRASCQAFRASADHVGGCRDADLATVVALL